MKIQIQSLFIVLSLIPLSEVSLFNSSLEQWDHFYFYEKVISTSEDGSDILYVQYKTPMGISYRDNCLLRRRQISENKWILIAKSIEHKDCPLLKDFVRAKTYLHATMIERDGKHTKMSVYSQQDFGGYIPQWIINMISKSRPKEWYKDLSAAIKKFQIRSRL